MSVKILAWVHWLTAVWPYAIGTIVAFFFVLLKGLPVIKEWFSAFTSGWSAKKYGLSSKLQDDPQLALTGEDRMQQPPVKNLSYPGVRDKANNRKSWLLKIGIMNFCIGFVALIVWLFGR